MSQADAAAGAGGLSARGLVKHYNRRSGSLRRAEQVRALDGIDLDLLPRRTVAIMGSTGAGKSTLARCLAGLERPDAGHIWLDGRDRLPVAAGARREERHEVQLLFQDVGTALNPRLTILESLAEPMSLRGWHRQDVRHRSHALLEEMGLAPILGGRKPREMSGGQRQRVAIARALAAEPRVLILDEALTGLDLSVQARILNLLCEVQSSRSLAYLYITHDPELISEIADETVVLRDGRIAARHG